MALPIILLMYAGRFVPIAVGVGSALSRLVLKNPKIIGGVISIQAISNAIQSHEATEKEKIDIVNEIGKENPQLRHDLFKNVFFPNANILTNILPYLVILLIIYLIIRKR